MSQVSELRRKSLKSPEGSPVKLNQNASELMLHDQEQQTLNRLSNITVLQQNKND